MDSMGSAEKSRRDMSATKMSRYTRHLQIRVTPEQHRAIKLFATANGTTTQDLIEGAIRSMLGRASASPVTALAGYEDKEMGRVVEFLKLGPPALKDAVLAVIASWEATRR